jgi:hypothetical protein
VGLMMTPYRFSRDGVSRQAGTRSGLGLVILRERVGASVGWVAAAAGVTERTVYRWEHDLPGGRPHVPAYVWDGLVEVAGFQGVMADRLLSGAAGVSECVDGVLVVNVSAVEWVLEGWSPQMCRVVLGLLSLRADCRFVRGGVGVSGVVSEENEPPISY